MIVKPKARHVRGFLWVLTLASIAFVLHYGWSLDFSGVTRTLREIHWVYFLLAAMLSVLHILLCGRLFSAALGEVKHLVMLPIFVASQIAKYVPGRVWGILMQKALIGDGSRTIHVVSANGRVAATVIASQLLVLAVIAGATGWIAPGVVLAMLVGCLGSGAALAWAARSTGWPLLAAWRGAGVAASSALYVAGSAVLTAAAWLVLYSAALDLEWADALEVVAVSAGSFLAGLASILPAGLGTRDAAYILFGSVPELSIDAALLPVLALVSRLWLVASDVLSSLLGFMWLMSQRRRRS